MPCSWIHSGFSRRKKKLREPWLSSALGAQEDILRTNAHCIRSKCVLFVKRTILPISVPPYLDSKPCTKGQKPPLSLSTTLTKGGHKDLDLISKGCKGHHKPITTPTSRFLCLPGVPLLILHGPCLLLGLIHLSILLSPLLTLIIHMPSHNLSGVHLSRGGGPSIMLLPPFCLHLLFNRNPYLLLHPGNLKCLPNRTRTPTIDRLSRYILGRPHALPMLWRSRRSI